MIIATIEYSYLLMSTESPICLFCLEQSSLENRVIQFNVTKSIKMPCTCRFDVHLDCWTIYFLKKGGFECPICHTKSGISPETRTEQNITLQSNNRLYTISVPIDTEQTIHIDIPSRSITERRCMLFIRGFITLGLCIVLFAGVITLLVTQGVR